MRSPIRLLPQPLQGLWRTCAQPPAHRQRIAHRIEHFQRPIGRLVECSVGTKRYFRGFQLICLDSHFPFGRIVLTTAFSRGCCYGWRGANCTPSLDTRIDYRRSTQRPNSTYFHQRTFGADAPGGSAYFYFFVSFLLRSQRSKASNTMTTGTINFAKFVIGAKACSAWSAV